MRASLVAGALLVAGGGAVAAYGATRPKRPGAEVVSTDPRVFVKAAIEARLTDARKALGDRVAQLAQQKPVQFAVASDVATTANLTYADLMFEPAGREIVELGQLGGGKVTSLTVLPATAPRFDHLGNTGTYLAVANDDLVMTVVGSVDPAARVDEGLVGRIAVSRSIDIAADVAPLREKGIAARIETPNGSMIIGADPGAGGEPFELGDRAWKVRLVAAPVAEPGGAASSLGWLLWPGVGAAAVGLVLVMMGLRKRPEPNLMFADTQMTPLAPIPAQAPGSSTAVGRPASRLIPQATPEGTNPAAGPMFGRYQLVRKLGAGGMADVFLARSQGEAGFSKLVALKLLHSHLASRPQAMAHFLDEARLASNLHHPNIVDVIDLGKVDEDYFIAMEYIEGSDLERLIGVGRIGGRYVPLPIAMTILRRICDGLDAAHKAVSPEGVPLNIVHRDVKSGNVLVSKQGQVKISDFGIAKASSQVHTTQIGETKGTPSVMAPEQRMGQIVDLRADVYSVAALGYELFTSAEMNLDLVQLAQLGIEGWPHLPPPSEVRNELPRELDAVLLGALAFQPEARPASCHDLEEALAQIANRYNLVCSDKDIARWLESELARMPKVADGGVLPSPAPPVGAAG